MGPTPESAFHPVRRITEEDMKFWRTPMDADQFSPSLGEIFIIANRCKGCGFCIEFCPRSALECSGEYNEKGYHPPIKKEDVECVNCGLCELICPELAIFTMKADGTSGTQGKQRRHSS